jgi:DNA-binding PadR family transcriptional regulator
MRRHLRRPAQRHHPPHPGPPEDQGWLTSRWEEIDPRAEGRPARRCYRLTPDGLQLAKAALARAYTTSARPAWLRPVGEEP